MTELRADDSRSGGGAVHATGTAVVVGATVVFLALSDTTFSVRCAGQTFRFAQFALLAAALWNAWSMRANGLGAMSGLPPTATVCALALAASFGVTSALSDEPVPTVLRAAWFLVNFGVCAAGVAWAARQGVLSRSLLLGVAGIACVVWIDAIAIHWFGLAPVLGGAQPSFVFEGVTGLRPHAFHYEPSYVACALALGSAATLCPSAAGRRWYVLATGLVLSAVVLTTSRAGMLAVGVAALTATVLLPFARGGGRMLANVGLSWSTAALFLCVFAVDPGGNRHLRMIAGPLGIARSIERVSQVADDGSGLELEERIRRLPPEFTISPAEARGRDMGRSEIGRLASYLQGLRAWRSVPWFGRGATRETDEAKDRIVAQGNMSSWIGLLEEFGAVGTAIYAALFGAVAWSLRPGRGPAGSAGGRLLASVLAAHFAVSFLLGPSFVRLDYCLLTLGALFAYGGASGTAQVTRASGDA